MIRSKAPITVLVERGLYENRLVEMRDAEGNTYPLGRMVEMIRAGTRFGVEEKGFIFPVGVYTMAGTGMVLQLIDGEFHSEKEIALKDYPKQSMFDLDSLPEYEAGSPFGPVQIGDPISTEEPVPEKPTKTKKEPKDEKKSDPVKTEKDEKKSDPVKTEKDEKKSDPVKDTKK